MVYDMLTVLHSSLHDGSFGLTHFDMSVLCTYIAVFETRFGAVCDGVLLDLLLIGDRRA